MEILLVDPDYAHRDAIASSLQAIGHRVRQAWDRRTVMGCLAESRFDVVVLADELPDGFGLDLVGSIRETTDCGIIMLSSRGDVGHRIVGLDSGVDDFLTKPVDLGEMAARLKAVWRRYRPLVLRRSTAFGEGEIDLFTRRLMDRTGTLVPLTPLEFAILAALHRAKGRALSREELLRDCYREDARSQPRAVDVMIRRVRSKLARADLPGVLISTHRGGGYALTVSRMSTAIRGPGSVALTP
jgi:two-component system OmpR family response regulator